MVPIALSWAGGQTCTVYGRRVVPVSLDGPCIPAQMRKCTASNTSTKHCQKALNMKVRHSAHGPTFKQQLNYVARARCSPGKLQCQMTWHSPKPTTCSKRCLVTLSLEACHCPDLWVRRIYSQAQVVTVEKVVPLPRKR